MVAVGSTCLDYHKNHLAKLGTPVLFYAPPFDVLLEVS